MHNACCGVTKREKRVGTMCGRLDAGETRGNRREAGAAAGLGASEQALSLSLSASQLAELAAATQRGPPTLAGFGVFPDWWGRNG